jgi:hypothetical protein
MRARVPSAIKGEITMQIVYQAPAIEDLGSIADHTFDNPGKGDKSSTPMETDKYGEYSHPFAS